jgi:hypothetical protein
MLKQKYNKKMAYSENESKFLSLTITHPILYAAEIINKIISSGIRAAGNKKAEIKGSYLGSAACCIWAAPASKAPTSGVWRATRPSTDCKKPMTIIKAMTLSSIN